MAGGSTLDPDNLPSAQGGTILGKGHGTAALGPSDTSDTGSDILGGPGDIDNDALGLDRGTNEDIEAGHYGDTAGASIGDADLDSDTDSTGTGEHASVGRSLSTGLDSDRGFDRIVGPDEAGLGGGLDQAEEALLGMTDEDIDAAARMDDADDELGPRLGVTDPEDDFAEQADPRRTAWARGSRGEQGPMPEDADEGLGSRGAFEPLGRTAQPSPGDDGRRRPHAGR